MNKDVFEKVGQLYEELNLLKRIENSYESEMPKKIKIDTGLDYIQLDENASIFIYRELSTYIPLRRDEINKKIASL